MAFSPIQFQVANHLAIPTSIVDHFKDHFKGSCRMVQGVVRVIASKVAMKPDMGWRS